MPCVANWNGRLPVLRIEAFPEYIQYLQPSGRINSSKFVINVTETVIVSECE